MRMKLFKVISNCLLIYWVCWFALVRNMWEFLSTSHAPINTNEDLANTPYLCLDLLSNLEVMHSEQQNVFILLQPARKRWIK